MPSKVVMVGKQPTEDVVKNLKKLLKTKNLMGESEGYKGRPSTQVFANGDWVVKLHTEWETSELNAKRWVKQHIEREAEIGVYPESKYWFIIGQDDSFMPGNICVHLKPIHEVIDDQSISTEQKMKWLEDIIAMYFSVYCGHERRLDEGLSNFVLDHENRVYYVDDETYEVDELLGLSQSVGVYLRSLPWFGMTEALQFGKVLKEQIQQAFSDNNLLHTFIRLLSDLYIADDRKELLNAVQMSLQPDQKRQDNHFAIEKGVAILADIHGNIAALEAVLEDIQKRNIQQVWVLGDIVGYGPYPSECIERIRKLDNCVVIKGNHDNALAKGCMPESFSRSARWSYEWMQDKVTDEQREWLEGTVPFYQHDQICAVHGAPMDSTFFNAYVYDMTYEANLDYMLGKKIQVCLHGHSHLAGAYVQLKRSEIRSFEKNQFLEFEAYDAVLACPGSVGQPRDGSHQACYAILSDTGLQWCYLDYDYEGFIKELKSLSYPDFVMKLFDQ